MRSFLLAASAAIFGAWGLGLAVFGCASSTEEPVVCAQSLKRLWQATTVYQQDHGESGELMGYPPLPVAEKMVATMFDDPCEEPVWHRFFAKTPYMYLPRESHQTDGRVQIPSFRELRQEEGDGAVLWSCLNHNDDIPAMVETYPYRSAEVWRGGTLMMPTGISGAWWQPHSKFWKRGENYWMDHLEHMKTTPSDIPKPVISK